jgi:hypothetical protein
MGIKHEHDRFSYHIFPDALGSMGARRSADRAKKDSKLVLFMRSRSAAHRPRDVPPTLLARADEVIE